MESKHSITCATGTLSKDYLLQQYEAGRYVEAYVDVPLAMLLEADVNKTEFFQQISQAVTGNANTLLANESSFMYKVVGYFEDNVLRLSIEAEIDKDVIVEVIGDTVGFRKKQYLKNKGMRCFYCGGANLEAGSTSVDPDGFSLTQEAWCKSCNKRWTDVYTLTDVREEEE